MAALTNCVTLSLEEAEIVKNEIKQLREENARLGIKEPRYRAQLEEDMKNMRQTYRPQKPPSKASQALLIAWAMLWYGIDYAYRRLSAINRSQPWHG